MRLTSVLLLLMFATGAGAQTDVVAGLLDGLETEADANSKVMAVLDGGDAATQAALFRRVMALEPDHPLRAIALHKALTGDEPGLRALALWEVIRNRGELALVYGPEEAFDDPELWETVRKDWGGLYQLSMYRHAAGQQVIEVYKVRDHVKNVSERASTLSVSGTTVTFTVNEPGQPRSAGVLTLNAAGDRLEGFVDNASQPRAAVYLDLY